MSQAVITFSQTSSCVPKRTSRPGAAAGARPVGSFPAYATVIAQTGRAGLLACACLLAAAPAHAASFGADLADLSFEELANIQITSVSKKEERLADAAASVFVITADAIRGSGAASLPEALRLAPNLQVAQSSNGNYAISARGFNGSNVSSPNKLLVLIDGRSVYTPLFSGVFWDVQDVVLDDVERIEVISGPGGTLWGTNAVNGVINVITRSASETRGALAAAGAGKRGSNTVFRYGGTLGDDGNYRVYGKYDDRKHTDQQDKSAADDASYKTQLGFRADWDRAGNRLTLQGNAYSGGEGQPLPGAISVSGVDLALAAITVSGVNLSAGWNRLLDGGSTLSAQAYFDRTLRTVPPTFSESLNIADLQLQHSLMPIGMHAPVWGANARYSMDRVGNSSYVAFLPASVDQKWISLFAQDEMSLRPDWRLIVGARLERNDYTGLEFLPNVRLAWKLAPERLLWSAVSRAVRAPSRLDSDVFIPGTAPFLLDGGSAVRSELATVYELGYRGQAAASLTYSVTAFHTVYDDLRTTEIAASRTYLTFGNGMQGTTNGIEAWGTYQAKPSWRLSAGFTALRERLWLKPSSNDSSGPNSAGNDPAYTWQLHSSWNGRENGEFDVGLRHVAKLSNNAVPAYTTLDARVGWKLRPGLDLSVTGQNLFGRHAEYGAGSTRSVVAPGLLAKLVWRN